MSHNHYARWDDFTDSSEDEIAVDNVLKEKNEYEVVATAVYVMSKPSQTDGIYCAHREKGAILKCDARKDNWVRLAEPEQLDSESETEKEREREYMQSSACIV